MPPNLQEVKLKFARRRSAKVMGSLADREKEPVEGEEVTGILVTHNFQSKIVAAEDLAAYTPLRVGSIFSKLHVPFVGALSTVRLFLTEMFAGVTETEEEATEGSEEGADKPITFGLHDGKVSTTWFYFIVIMYFTTDSLTYYCYFVMFSTASSMYCTL